METLQLNNIYNMDCLVGLQMLPDKCIDTVITDLPYGIDYQSNHRVDKFPKIANDKKPFVEFIKHIPRVLKDTGAVYLFTRWDVQQPVIDEMEDCGLDVKNVIIWDKGNHTAGDLKRSYGYIYESIVFHSAKDFEFQDKRPIDIIHCMRVSADKMVHPNEKPVTLLRRLILDSTPPYGVVLDATMGSGTTMLAAIKEKRQYVGFELDKHYYDVAKKRIDNENSILTLF